jgi:acyl-ACP thioesterase
MKLTGALETIQDCSLLWLESEPSFWNYLTAKNLGMFIVSRQVDIVRLPVYGERITVQTRIFDCNGFLGYRNTALYGEDGLPCLLTWGLGLFVNMDTGKMARIPKNEIEKITIDQKLEMEYLDKKIRVPDIPGRRSEAVVVKRGDIDLYRHMNNVKYIEVALEFLPEDFEINRLRIEYKKSAKMGDVLYPQIIEESSAHWYILLPDAQGNPFAVMEIS